MKWPLLFLLFSINAYGTIGVFFKEDKISKTNLKNIEYQEVFNHLTRFYENKINLKNPELDTNLELDTIVYGLSFDIRKGLGLVNLSASQSMEFHMKVENDI
jgi:hypothetical protein